MGRPPIHGATWRHLREAGCTPEYSTWRGIIDRCTNPNNRKWHLYGGIGVSIDASWRYNFLTFLEHVGKRPGPKHSIDRIDPHGNYEPGNVRWSDIVTQNNNRRWHPKKDPATGRFLQGSSSPYGRRSQYD